MTQILVIDESWAREPAAAVKAAGYVGVIGYVSHDATKALHGKDVRDYHSEGLGVAFVFEDYARRAQAGAPAGQSDGQYANQYLDKLGAPADLPIYYAVDFQPTTGQIIQVVEYVSAAGAEGRPSRGYGNAAVCEALAAHAGMESWQTAAWSGSTVSTHAVLYQRTEHTTHLAGAFDEDVVLGSLADAGFWFGANAPTPTPTPKDDDLTPEESATLTAIAAAVGRLEIAIRDPKTGEGTVLAEVAADVDELVAAEAAPATS